MYHSGRCRDISLCLLGLNVLLLYAFASLQVNQILRYGLDIKRRHIDFAYPKKLHSRHNDWHTFVADLQFPHVISDY